MNKNIGDRFSPQSVRKEITILQCCHETKRTQILLLYKKTVSVPAQYLLVYSCQDSTRTCVVEYRGNCNRAHVTSTRNENDVGQYSRNPDMFYTKPKDEMFEFRRDSVYSRSCYWQSRPSLINAFRVSSTTRVSILSYEPARVGTFKHASINKQRTLMVYNIIGVTNQY